MRLEIERKFLVTGDGWSRHIVSRHILRDGLISQTDRGKVRVRIDAERAWLTVKGARSGIARAEYEYEIPLEDAEEMLRNVCRGQLIEKTRFCVLDAGHLWTIDRFHGRLEGVVWAEIELQAADEVFERPDWVGEEVTADPRFRQTNLLDLCASGPLSITMETLFSAASDTAGHSAAPLGVLHAAKF
ncbi:CYTH domain-containing protein [Aurantimonas sp. Leaf443]|uniref:CYTH domain-containing protein n=1 Tax=Aurantimonas sp. Leaf443 TaxID=1736378 RepID=UPI0006F56A80|nr:CYTH domain-containing protein [Aurantimonas sp. Leaf443]KQT86204.1 hypothetical protein ASG48_06455 [Aurantimonas sp. Leaf443]